jgi:hypothetical protein
MTTDAMPDDVRHHIASVLAEDMDRRTDHLAWLDANPGEADRDLQRAETERAIELATKAAAFFPLAVD